MSDTETKPKISSNRSLLSPLWLVRHEAFMASVARLTEIDLSAYYGRSDSAVDEKPYEVKDGVAIIHMSGYLTRDMSWWNYYFGGTSSIYARMQVMAAAEDEEASAILLCCYSPGGEVYGVGDLHDAIVAAGKKKKTWAYIADEGCSALYWAICGCAKIVCNATAIVGSIGVMSVVQDWSKAYQKAGIKVEVFKSGEHKGAGETGTSLTDEQRAEKQRMVDAIADKFFAAVEAGRGLEDDALDAVTDGRVFVGEEAREMGLVDEIGTLETVLARLIPKPAESTNQTRLLRYGATNTNPPNAAGKQETIAMNWREKLAAALAKLGLHGMAGLVLGAQDDNMEGLAAQLYAQVNAEAQAQITAHPLLGALTAAGITTPEQVTALVREAADGRAASAEANKALEVAAVRRFGQGDWSQYIQAYQHLPLAQRKEVAAQWEKDADEKFGTKPKQAAARQTAPTALPTHALEADEKPSALTADERARVRKTAEQVAKNGGTR